MTEYQTMYYWYEGRLCTYEYIKTDIPQMFEAGHPITDCDCLDAGVTDNDAWRYGVYFKEEHYDRPFWKSKDKKDFDPAFLLALMLLDIE